MILNLVFFKPTVAIKSGFEFKKINNKNFKNSTFFHKSIPMLLFQYITSKTNKKCERLKFKSLYCNGAKNIKEQKPVDHWRDINVDEVIEENSLVMNGIVCN